MERPLRADTMRGGVIVAGATAVNNVASYAFTILAARILGPRGYGAFAALMALLLLVNVVSVGMQTTIARRVAHSASHWGSISDVAIRVARRLAVVLGLVCLICAPLVTSLLRLPSIVPALALSLPAAAFVVMGRQVGVLQGLHHWWHFAAVFSSIGLARLGVGAIVIAAIATSSGAMIGVALASLVPIVVGAWALRRLPASAPAESPTTAASTRSIWREIAHNSHTLFAFFALSGIDILLARLVLPAHDAGLYAAGLILTKAVLFLPQFVSVVVFPSIAHRGAAGSRLHLAGLAAVGCLGGAVVVVTALLPRLALVFVGGAEYTDVVPSLWLFALLGTISSAIQLLLFAAIALRHRTAVWWVWTAVGLVLVGSSVVDSLTQLLGLVITVNAALLLTLVLLTKQDRITAVAAL